MQTAFGILLFVLAYGPVAYMVYADVKGQRPRVRRREAVSARQPRNALHAVGQ